MSWLSFGKANNVQAYTNKSGDAVKIRLSNMGKETERMLQPSEQTNMDAQRDCIGDVEASTTIIYKDREYKYTFMISPNSCTDRIDITDSGVIYNGKPRGMFTGGKGYGEAEVMQKYIYEARQAMERFAIVEAELAAERLTNIKISKLNEDFTLMLQHSEARERFKDECIANLKKDCDALKTKYEEECMRSRMLMEAKALALSVCDKLNKEKIILQIQCEKLQESTAQLAAKDILIKKLEDELNPIKTIVQSMHDVLNGGRCIEPGCGKRCSFGFPGTTEKIYCKQHATKDCINLARV